MPEYVLTQEFTIEADNADAARRVAALIESGNGFGSDHLTKRELFVITYRGERKRLPL